MSEAQGSKNGAAKEKSTAASAKVSAMESNVQDDLQALRDDVAKLTQQLADLASAKGGEIWERARGAADGVFSDAAARGREATDAVGEVGDNLAAALDESLENRPYTTLALTLAAGFVLGAIWKR
jgi:ElaB/YqjD/DUF883 family membrane-anchored ribosome-binding protein